MIQYDDLQQNQDGTLSNGYVSISGGRHRIIVTDEPSGQANNHTDVAILVVLTPLYVGRAQPIKGLAQILLFVQQQ